MLTHLNDFVCGLAGLQLMRRNLFCAQQLSVAHELVESRYRYVPDM